MVEVVYIELLLFGTSIYGIVNFSKLSTAFKYLLTLTIVAFFAEILGTILSYRIGTSYPSYHVLSILAIPLHTLIYSRLVKLNKLTLSLLFFTGAILMLTALINTIFYQSMIRDFPSNNLIMLSLLTIILTLVTFLRMIKVPSDKPLKNQPIFWLNMGNFIFYNLTFFVFAFLNHFYNYYINWIYLLIPLSSATMYTMYFLSIHTEIIRSNNG